MSSSNLEKIGFYTLSDYRAAQTSIDSPLWRCEMILTNKCNFNCPYCRGLRKDIDRELSFDEARNILNIWVKQGLKNIRFSGGEPTLWPHLVSLISICLINKVEKIAISTNGSANYGVYERLINHGVNDFSISLDSCCAAVGDKMAGGKTGAWQKVVDNIRNIRKNYPKVYVSVGVVVNEENIHQFVDTVEFAESLGVSDIRFIPSAQFNQLLTEAEKIPEMLLKKYPILNYRVQNIKNGRNVRGLQKHDCQNCYLVLDDMAVAGEYHFPCIIYMREQGNPIGKIGPNVRSERLDWMLNHDCQNDPICKKNCLDVCIDYNNKVEEIRNKETVDYLRPFITEELDKELLDKLRLDQKEIKNV
jgi:molybdenum cofactor biosynthesis enzyme MoaA